MTIKKEIKDFSYSELRDIFTKRGYAPFRVDQIFHWLYKKKIDTFQEMINLPKEMIVWLNSFFQLTKIKCIDRQKSMDGSEKYLFQVSDQNFIETVLIRTKKRNTVCLSSQVGCLWQCLFCASGKDGMKRNLNAGEMVDQLLTVEKVSQENIQNVVFMGMGEPFNNYENLIKAIEMINAKKGINIGARKITISTCGIIPGINKLACYPLQVNLSVSLHSADPETRSFLMPVNKKYPLDQLILACKDYIKKKKRQITFEYLLLKNINDSQEQALKLIHLINGMEAKVNIIIYNSLDDCPNLIPSDKKIVVAFQKILQRENIPVTIRYSRGQEIQAACGQLRRRQL